MICRWLGVPQALVLLLVVVDHRLEEGEARRTLDEPIPSCCQLTSLPSRREKRRAKPLPLKGQREALISDIQRR